MSTTRPVEVFWNGELVGSLLESEVETVGVPFVRQPDGTLHLESLSQAKVHGRWTAADGPVAREFLSHLRSAEHCEVSVQPYSQNMSVLFALCEDGEGWLFCRARA